MQACKHGVAILGLHSPLHSRILRAGVQMVVHAACAASGRGGKGEVQRCRLLLCNWFVGRRGARSGAQQLGHAAAVDGKDSHPCSGSSGSSCSSSLQQHSSHFAGQHKVAALVVQRHSLPHLQLGCAVHLGSTWAQQRQPSGLTCKTAAAPVANATAGNSRRWQCCMAPRATQCHAAHLQRVAAAGHRHCGINSCKPLWPLLLPLRRDQATGPDPEALAGRVALACSTKSVQQHGNHKLCQ